MKSKRGFTLIELIIVMAVIAVLSAIIIPTFASAQAKSRRSADNVTLEKLNVNLGEYLQNNVIENEADIRNCLTFCFETEDYERDFKAEQAKDGKSFYLNLVSGKFEILSANEVEKAHLQVYDKFDEPTVKMSYAMPERVLGGYILCDTYGSTLADVVSEFYKVTDYNTLNELRNDILKLSNEQIKNSLLERVDTSLFYTPNGLVTLTSNVANQYGVVFTKGTSVVQPSNIDGMTSIESIYVPKYISELKEGAFKNITAKSVVFDGTHLRIATSSLPTGSKLVEIDGEQKTVLVTYLKNVTIENLVLNPEINVTDNLYIIANKTFISSDSNKELYTAGVVLDGGTFKVTVNKKDTYQLEWSEETINPVIDFYQSIDDCNLCDESVYQMSLDHVGITQKPISLNVKRLQINASQTANQMEELLQGYGSLSEAQKYILQTYELLEYKGGLYKLKGVYNTFNDAKTLYNNLNKVNEYLKENVYDVLNEISIDSEEEVVSNREKLRTLMSNVREGMPINYTQFYAMSLFDEIKTIDAPYLAKLSEYELHINAVLSNLFNGVLTQIQTRDITDFSDILDNLSSVKSMLGSYSNTLAQLPIYYNDYINQSFSDEQTKIQKFQKVVNDYESSYNKVIELGQTQYIEPFKINVPNAALTILEIARSKNTLKNSYNALQLVIDNEYNEYYDEKDMFDKYYLGWLDNVRHLIESHFDEGLTYFLDLYKTFEHMDEYAPDLLTYYDDLTLLTAIYEAFTTDYDKVQETILNGKKAQYDACMIKVDSLLARCEYLIPMYETFKDFSFSYDDVVYDSNKYSSLKDALLNKLDNDERTIDQLFDFNTSTTALTANNYGEFNFTASDVDATMYLTSVYNGAEVINLYNGTQVYSIGLTGVLENTTSKDFKLTEYYIYNGEKTQLNRRINVLSLGNGGITEFLIEYSLLDERFTFVETNGEITINFQDIPYCAVENVFGVKVLNTQTLQITFSTNCAPEQTLERYISFKNYSNLDLTLFSEYANYKIIENAENCKTAQDLPMTNNCISTSVCMLDDINDKEYDCLKLNQNNSDVEGYIVVDNGKQLHGNGYTANFANHDFGTQGVGLIRILSGGIVRDWTIIGQINTSSINDESAEGVNAMSVVRLDGGEIDNCYIVGGWYGIRIKDGGGEKQTIKNCYITQSGSACIEQSTKLIYKSTVTLNNVYMDQKNSISSQGYRSIGLMTKLVNMECTYNINGLYSINNEMDCESLKNIVGANGLYQTFVDMVKSKITEYFNAQNIDGYIYSSIFCLEYRVARVFYSPDMNGLTGYNSGRFSKGITLIVKEFHQTAEQREENRSHFDLSCQITSNTPSLADISNAAYNYFN